MEANADEHAPGVFTWELANNRLFGDGAVAHRFELCPEAAFDGLPIQTYIERIHADDQRSVARSIHDGVLSGRPTRQEYRIAAPGGPASGVIVLGRCFRNGEGEPHLYTGIVFPKFEAGTGSAPLLDACMHAHWTALESGRPDVAARLVRITRECGLGGSPTVCN